MNADDLKKFHETLTQEALSIMLKKNNDYAGSKFDTPFANFERAEKMGVCSVEQAFLVRILDKISRLATYTNTGKLEVESEGVRDAILDLVNYLILLGAYVDSKTIHSGPQNSIPSPSDIQEYLDRTYPKHSRLHSALGPPS